jgi:hypothetical protein
MSPASEHLTVAELQRLLDSRKQQLLELSKKRTAIQKELDSVNAQISALEGGKVVLGARGRRKRNPRPLRKIVEELLLKSKKGLTLAELSAKVMETGYKTSSKNFRNVLYQCLYNTKGVYHDSSSGTYKFKPPAPKEPKPSATEAPSKSAT